MTPTIGRIVHLTPSAEQIEATMGYAQCRAAIVTGVESQVGGLYFYASAYSYRGDQSPVVVREASAWHDPRECPYQIVADDTIDAIADRILAPGHGDIVPTDRD